MKYEPTIGLEIHAELNTRTKMFCDSLNDPDEKNPNVNVCPVCLGHPGALPVINKDAVERVIKVGLALGGKIAKRSKFDRKNYFYPDLPKGYQISQYDEPLVEGGELLGVRIRRIHLEEDAGNLVHDKANGSLVDFNRAGVPLMELVTEPDIRSAEQAVAFAKELQLILRYLKVSHANMEKGEMRVEVNISMNMGTKAELKNINSFRAVEGGVAYEIKRQTELLESGEEVKQETRGWDDSKKATVSQRSKEEAQDYRYFPEPDLPPFTTDVFDLEKIKTEMPELPEDKRQRFGKEYGLGGSQLELLIEEPELAEYLEESASELKLLIPDTGYATLANYLLTDLRGLMQAGNIGWSELKIEPEHLAHLVSLIAQNKITSRVAKDVLAKMADTGLDPEAIVREEGLEAVSDEGAITEVVKKIIGANEKAVADYKAGKEASLQFLVGQAMKELRGKGDPQVLKDTFEKEIKKDR